MPCAPLRVFTEMCSGSEAGSYVRLIDFCTTRVIKKKRRGRALRSSPEGSRYEAEHIIMCTPARGRTYHYELRTYHDVAEHIITRLSISLSAPLRAEHVIMRNDIGRTYDYVHPHTPARYEAEQIIMCTPVRRGFMVWGLGFGVLGLGFRFMVEVSGFLF